MIDLAGSGIHNSQQAFAQDVKISRPFALLAVRHTVRQSAVNKYLVTSNLMLRLLPEVVYFQF